jgi:hypothetical protein
LSLLNTSTDTDTDTGISLRCSSAATF